jgi:hypothetical protein
MLMLVGKHQPGWQQQQYLLNWATLPQPTSLYGGMLLSLSSTKNPICFAQMGLYFK